MAMKRFCPSVSRTRAPILRIEKIGDAHVVVPPERGVVSALRVGRKPACRMVDERSMSLRKRCDFRHTKKTSKKFEQALCILQAERCCELRRKDGPAVAPYESRCTVPRPAPPSTDMRKRHQHERSAPEEDFSVSLLSRHIDKWSDPPCERDGFRRCALLLESAYNRQ